MPLSRKSKLWIAFVGAPLVLVVAAVVALKLYFNDERLKSMVIPRVEEMTGRTVSIRDLSLTIFPSIALAMEGVTISNLKSEGFSAEPFLTLESLHLDVNLVPLFRSRVEVNSFEVSRPRVLLEVNNASQTNYSNLTTGGKPPQATGSQTAGPEGKPVPGGGSAFAVANLLVHGGVIDYLDHRDNSAIRVRNLDLAMEVAGGGNTVVITGNASTDSLSYGSAEKALLSGLRLRLDHRFVYDRAQDRLSVERGDLMFQDMRLVLAGTVSEVTGNSILDLTLGSDSLNIADLFSLIPGEYREKARGARGEGIAQVRIAITGTLTDSTSADIVSSITAKGASLQYANLPKPITNISVLIGLTRTAKRQELRIDNLTASLGETPIRLAMTVTNFDDPYLNLSAGGTLNLATLPEYYPLEPGTELRGAMTVDVRVAGRVSAPNALKADGSLTFRDVSVKTGTTPSPISGVNGTVTFSNEVAESKQFSMAIGSSDMALAWRVRNYLSMISSGKKGPRPIATMTLRSNHLFVRDVTGRDDAPSSGGKAESKTKPGGTPPGGLPAPAKRGPFLLPDVEMEINASIKKLTLEKFEFSDVRGTLRVSDGVVTMQSLNLNAFGGSVVSSGSLSLTTPDRPAFDLNLSLNALEATSLLTPFTSIGQRLNGSLSMNTTLKGTLDDTLGLVTDALQGKGTVAVRNGALKGVGVNKALAGALNLPDLETIQFKDWGNEFAVQNGRLVIRDLKIDALNAQYVVNGSQGLDGSLDYSLTLYLPESAGPKIKVSGFAGEAVNLFKDQSGRFKFDFNVGGTMESPKLQLETGSVQKRAEELVNQKLDQEKKKLENQLKEKAGDALKKLFKK